MSAAKKAAPIDNIDRSRLGPNGEIPWEPPEPVAPFAGLDELYKKERSVGYSRVIGPCPSSGKITFKQIGDLREYNGKPINMNDSRLLNCRQPAPLGNGGYYQPAATNDPSDYYNAVWGSEGVVNRGRVLPMNPIGSWNENFPSPYPLDNDNEENSFKYRGVEASGNGCRLYAISEKRRVFIGYDQNNPGYGIYEDRFYPRTVNAVSYVGRFDAGTRLSMAFDTTHYSSYPDWQVTMGWWGIRGWTQGFFNGSVKEYASGGVWRKATNYPYVVDIEVDDAHKDIWIALEQSGDPDNDDEQWFSLNNFWIWRT